VRPHEVERLSAYIDRELSPAERGTVEAHLRDCFECARRLAELTAVDAAVRELPLDPPPGYFEGFPGRLRERFGPVPRRMPRRAPWLLAAAAGLLLAVLTPAVLRNTRGPAPRTHPDAGPATPPGQAQPTDPTDQKRRVAESPDRLSAPAETTPRRQEVAPSAAPVGRLAANSASRPAPPLVQRPRGADREAGGTAPAAAPVAPPAAAEGFAFADRPLAPSSERPRKDQSRETATGPRADRDEARQRKAAGEGFAEEQAALPTPPATTPPSASGVAPRAKADDFAADPQEVDKTERVASAEPKPAASGAAAAGALARRSGRRAQADAVTVTGDAPSDVNALSTAQERFEALLERPFTTAADARRLRESWRAFASDFPEGPGADEARVRIVETGAAAYRLGADREDLVLARRDGAEYLKRAPAPQAKRVREVLDALLR
jgi:anti-sigma factor RsiW